MTKKTFSPNVDCLKYFPNFTDIKIGEKVFFPNGNCCREMFEGATK